MPIDIRDRPISEKRKTEIIKKLISTAKINSIARILLSVRPIREEEQEEEFFKLGMNIILPKGFVVDKIEEDDAYYFYERLGYHEGNSIAEGETKALFDKILEIGRSSKIEKDEFLSVGILEEAIGKLRQKGFNCDFILSNIYDVFDFWQFGGIFKGVAKIENEERGTPRLEGHYRDIPVYWNRLIPNGTLILVDSKKLGEFIVKRDITADISELTEPERKKFVDLKEKDNVLREKVRLYVDEVVKIKVPNENAFMILQIKSKKED